MNRLQALALGTLLAAGTARAADLPDRDRTFLRDQAQGTSYELAIAQLAAGKGTAPDVKSYAQALVSDHDQLNADLHQLAAAKSVDLPTNMTARQQAGLARLQKLSGRAFDRAYKAETTRINANDVRDDAAELKATTDPDIRGFVEKLQATDAKHADAGRKLRV